MLSIRVSTRNFGGYGDDNIFYSNSAKDNGKTALMRVPSIALDPLPSIQVCLTHPTSRVWKKITDPLWIGESWIKDPEGALAIFTVIQCFYQSKIIQMSKVEHWLYDQRPKMLYDLCCLLLQPPFNDKIVIRQLTRLFRTISFLAFPQVEFCSCWAALLAVQRGLVPPHLSTISRLLSLLEWLDN